MITFGVSAAANGSMADRWDRPLDGSLLSEQLSDHLRLDLVEARGGRPSDRFIAVLAVAGAAASNELVGMGQVSGANDADLMELAVTDDFSDPERLLEDLMETTVDAQRSTPDPRPLRWWTDLDAGPVVDAAGQRGFTLERQLFQMKIDLGGRFGGSHRDDGPTRSTIDTRAFDPTIDPAPLLALNNRSFAGHGEQGGWTMADLRQRLDEPWFRPDALRILGDEGTLVGFCWTKPHGADVGEIYVIGVDPDATGRGLGTALVVDGLHTIADSGASQAMLWVDADNARALRLYERLGFTIQRTRSAYLLVAK